MSWDAYVKSLVDSRHVDQAALFSAAGDSVWAASDKFEVTPAEMKVLVGGFVDSGKMFGEGFHLNGTKYITIKADDRSIYGKQGKEGAVVVKTKLAIIVTHYPADVQPGVAAKTVEEMADYLIKLGY